MADYHPLIAKAVAGLEKNTGEARRALYERARTALVAQLRGVVPALDEAEITRERLSLEESIRKVEAEAARQSRFENRPPTVARPPRPPASSRETAAPAASAQPPEAAAEAPPPPERPAHKEPPRSDTPTDQSAEQPPLPPLDIDAAVGSERQEPRLDMPPRPAARSRAPGERGSLSDEASKSFRGELEAPSSPEAKAGRRSRGAYVPPVAHEFDRLESARETPVDPETLDSLVRSSRQVGVEPPPEFSDSRPTPSRPRPSQPQQREPQDQALEEKPARSSRGLVVPIIAFTIFFALCGAAIWYRAPIIAVFQALTAPSGGQVARDATPPSTPSARPKISDRIGSPQDAGQPGQTARGAPGVAQRVVLYEQDPSDPQGKRYVGSAIWRTETISPGAGLPPELAIKADVEIPERRMTMTWSLRRNTDKNLPASHTIEIMINLPPDFQHGGVTNVPGILMKQEEQARGTPLAGLAVKVTTGFFLVGLSAVDADVQRNLQLLKERSWFDIPIVYNNDRRAILAVEKGVPGDRAFSEAFAAWKQ